VVVVGVDPGTQRCGYGVVARTGSRLRVVESGVLVPGDHDLPRRLALILEGLEAILARSRADAVAVETVFAGVSPRSALVLGQARGGRAEKAQMIRMARALFGVEAVLADEADAIALALCHIGHAPRAGSAA
jgi:crossover junction endodeoxyribonuclease RuvC